MEKSNDNNYQFSLMPEEILKFQRFQNKHHSCDPEVREAMIEESCAPTMTSIILHQTSIGMCPSARCEVCDCTESIICNERLDSF